MRWILLLLLVSCDRPCFHEFSNWEAAPNAQDSSILLRRHCVKCGWIQQEHVR